MTQKPLDPSKIQSVLKSVRQGMEVKDVEGNGIGTVKDLYFGADSDEMKEHGVGAATAPDPSVRENSLVENVAEALVDFGADLPQEMRQRLINEGYIRIDTAGLFRSDRFILPEQIARVHDDHVHLNVTQKELLKD